MRLPAGRLLWKLFTAFWLAMVMWFLIGMLLINLSGGKPPPATPWEFTVPLLAGTLVSLPFSLGLAWYLYGPIRHLAEAMRAAAAARFEVRIRPRLGSRRDELADLAHEFDGMAAQLQASSERQRQLFHDVSHELRSPLARMQAAIGLMEQNAPQAQPIAERLRREADRLNALVEELLTLHKLEAGTLDRAPGKVDLIELLTAITQDAEFEAQSRQCTVTLQAPDTFVTTVDGELVYRALENVVRNAVKYTAAQSEIQIQARIRPPRDDGMATLEICVADRGPGVPAELCEAIFEPFRRIPGTDPGNNHAAGTGLGLAIAQRAIALHGGTIRAQPRPGGGLEVLIALPSSS